MKGATTSKEAIKIFKEMEARLAQLWDKLVTGNYNSATQFAFEIGFISDIDNALIALNVPRTLTKLKGVSEIEAKDIEPYLKKLL